MDYGSGNLRSAAKAFERAARETQLEADIVVTSDARIVARADRIVLPGVGAFADCRAGLRAVPGMLDALSRRVMEQGVPFFGICVGMQLMAETGLEKGTHEGLGWIEGTVVPLDPDSSAQNDTSFKIPHMGWNSIELTRSHPVLEDLSSGNGDRPHAYFVHSFHLEANNPDHLLARTDYGGPVSAIVGHSNLIGSQFHPEKSQKTGLQMIAGFLRWSP